MQWLLYFDLFGVFVFALSGGFDGAKYRLDLFGILVLALATSLGGGIMRRLPLLLMKRIFLLPLRRA